MRPDPKPVAVLLVEDNEDDVFLMRRIFRKEEIATFLQVVTDGKQAIQYLEGAEPFTDRARFPLPQLVFLDLKLPYFNGFDVLARVRRNPELSLITVIVLSSSLEDKDRETAHSFGVSYFVKPPSSDLIHQALAALSSDKN